MFIQLTKAFMGKPPGERIDVSDVDAQGLVTAGIATAVPADDAINSLVQKLTGSIAESMTKSLDAVINATLTKFKEAQSQAKRHAVPAIFGEGANGDPKKNFGDWLYKVAKQRPRHSREGLRQHLQPLAEGSARRILRRHRRLHRAARVLRPATGHRRREQRLPAVRLRPADGIGHLAVSRTWTSPRLSLPARRPSSAA